MTDPFRPDLLRGKTVIVTGGGTGLGRSIALRMANLGAKVAVLGRRPDPLAETVKTIRDAGAVPRAWQGSPRDVRLSCGGGRRQAACSTC